MNITTLLLFGLLVLVVLGTVLYRLLITNFIIARQKHKEFESTVESRRKNMQDNFIRLGKSFEEMEESANKTAESVKDIGKGISEMKKCNWKSGSDKDDTET